MNKRQTLIIEEARRLLRTPYHKDGRNLQSGIDCVYFVVLAHERAGFPLPLVQKDMTGIDAINDNRLIEFLESKGGVRISEESQWQSTDIVLMNYGAFPHHTGILTRQNPDNGIWQLIHCTAKHGMVVEEPLQGKLQKRLNSVWRSPDVS